MIKKKDRSNNREDKNETSTKKSEDKYSPSNISSSP